MTYKYGVLPIGTTEIAEAKNWALRRSGPADSARAVSQAVARYAEHDPGRLAVVDGDARLSYHQLWRRASATAARLRRAGCQAGDVVAVCGPRSGALIAAWLAIECCQAIYLPLEERWPERRLAELVTSSGAAFILSLSERPHDNDPARVAAKSAGVQFLAATDDGEGPAAQAPGLTPDRACYLIYTSGSTGVPKGVLIEQRGMLNHLRAKATDLRLTERDSVALTAPLAFDISIWQMLTPLLVGGTVHVVRAADDPGRLVADLARLSTSVVELVPTVIGLVLDELTAYPGDPPLPDLRWLLATGEELPPKLAARCLDGLPHVRLMNAYGPAECSDDVTHHVLSGNVADARHLPIGGPVMNTALYVLRWDDGGWAACAPGESGELFVGGHGVGRGYLADAERTSGAFFIDPFDPSSPTGRLYRTGDMVRVTGDGILEYLGRADRQVKVAGVRIELAEIEAVLRQHPAVRACAVTLVARDPAVALVARETRLGGSRELAAYYVGEPASGRDLARFLRERLPEQSVPRRWSRLDTLPFTPNGKVDYGALPLPEDRDTSARRELPTPASAMERVVFDEVTEVLGTGWASNESFVELGGDSLQAMVLAARLRAAGYRVSVRDILTADAITQLAGALKPAGADVPTPPGDGSGDGARTRGLTPEQLGVYFQWRLEPDSPYYTYQGVLRIAGPVDWTRLDGAWSVLLDENPNLLARITEEGAGAVQHFPAWAVPLGPPEDLSALRPVAGEAAFRERAAREATRPFRLDQEPIVRVAGFRLGDADHRLILTMHEILLDGWGAMVLIQRLGALYAAGQPAAEPARRMRFDRYLDYREGRLRTADTAQAGEYWRKELGGHLPVLDLPADPHSGRSRSGYRGRTVERVLDGDSHARLGRTCRTTGCTPFMVILAGYALTLGYYSGADEVVIGAPFANREDHERIDIPTFALNMLPLKIEMPPDRTLAGHLAHVRRKVTDAYAAADYPFAWMLQGSHHSRSGPRTPVFQTMLNALMYPAEQIYVNGARWSFTELDTGYTKYDCALYLQRNGSESLTLQFVHQAGLLPEDLAGSLLESVLTAVSAISDRSTETIGTVDLLTPSHRIALAEFEYGGHYDPI
jgi:amino acid adenylation domain-containing protein